MQMWRIRLESFSPRIPENIVTWSVDREVGAGEGIKSFARWDDLSLQYCNYYCIIILLYSPHYAHTSIIYRFYTIV